MRRFYLIFFLMVISAAQALPSVCQSPEGSAPETAAIGAPGLPDAPSPAQQNQPSQPSPSAPYNYEGKQTKRILGIIPNFRSVGVNETLPPLSTRDKFKLTFEDSFDYSNFIYVGILSGVSQAESSYPEFHTGAPAYGRYYWHNFADTLNGNLMTEFTLPVITKEDPRYYTLGRGGLFKRTGYTVGRLFVTRTDGEGRSFNFSEIVGNGAAAGIANLYYPGEERTWTKTGQRWVTQIGLDGFANLLKEFWPDVNSKLFHNKY